LLVFIAKNIPLKSPKYDFTSPKYNKLNVDKLPVIKKFEPLNYILLLEEYKAKHGKILKPVNSRGKNPVPTDCVCPICGAPHTYLDDNTGGRGQLLCKVCNNRFARG
jgi:rubredoxin